MGLPAEKHRYSIQEYLELEEKSDVRHEFQDGEILAMAGTTYQHSVIFMNLAGLLTQRLRGSACQPLDSNLRVRIPLRQKYVYPDISIVCGKPLFDEDDPGKKTIVNPKVLVEILSQSTASYDRGDKFSLYREIPSFEEYVLISQHQAMVETFLRQSDGSWRFHAYHGIQVDVTLRSLPLIIPVKEIYAGVELEPSAADDLPP